MKYDALFLKYTGFIYSLLMGYDANRDLCRDLYQEVYLKVNRAVSKGTEFETERDFSWYLTTTARSVYIDWYRKQSRKREVRCKYPPRSNGLTPERQLILNQTIEEAMKRADLLRPNWRETFMMRVKDQLSFKEICEKTGKTMGAALGEMRYARLELKKQVL